MESQEYSACSEGASRPVVETGAGKQVDGDKADEVNGGEGLPEDYSYA